MRIALRGAESFEALAGRVYAPLMASVQKEIREIVREAERQGWRVERRKSGVSQLYAPDGENIVTAHSTPSDRRALRNMIANMRQFGFEWKGR